MTLAGVRVGVTGAGGFIGRAVCAALTAQGADVVGLDVTSDARPRVQETGATFVECDTRDAPAVELALSECRLVVHTAAIVSDWGSMADFVAVNVGGTRNVLDAASAAGAERIVHISSVAAWGYEFPRRLREDALPRVCGAPYVDTKAASHALAAARGATIVRPGDVYGPGSVPWAIRPFEALEAGRLYVPRGGGGIVTPVYIDDLVDCIVRSLTHPEAGGEAFTAWDGRPIRAADFFAFYARMLGRETVPSLPRPLLDGALRLQDTVARIRGRPPVVSRAALIYISRRATYPNARAREILGWEPQVTLEDGMARTEEWFREVGMLPA
jgi:2-alkyl-3-oxoalkanoate reductase